MGIESSNIKNECEDAVHRLYHYLDNELTDDLRIKIKNILTTVLRAKKPSTLNPNLEK